MRLLENKVAIVTGAGSGIGRAIAQLYAEEGAKVVVSDLDEQKGKETLTMIKDKGFEAIFMKADVGNADDCKKTVDQAVKTYGALHIACNNAGIAGKAAPIGDLTPADFDKVIKINLSGVFYGMHYQIPAMLKAGGGNIVNMASILGQVGMAGSSAYVSAKHGVVGITKNAALEYAKEGIRVNAVGPGFIETPLLTNNLSEDQMKQIRALHPLGRMGKATEVAELVLWLSSPKASFTSGNYFPLDGGYLAQ